VGGIWTFCLGVLWVLKKAKRVVSQVKGGVKLRKKCTKFFCGKPSFIQFFWPPLSFFPWAPPVLLYIYFHCSYLYNYYNYFRTLVHEMMSFSSSYPDLIKISLLCGPHLKRGVFFGAERRPKERVTLWKTLLSLSKRVPSTELISLGTKVVTSY
jgi:hypothetical protein